MLPLADSDGDVSFASTAMKGRTYTWSQGETLVELRARSSEIMEKHDASLERARKNRRNIPLFEVLSQALDDDDDASPCQVCSL